jgi:pyruvate dehydrogenase E1 component alpha subunit
MPHSDRLSDSDLIQMYRWLVLIREFEDRVAALWAEGKMIELPHGSQGQEAIAVGACYGLRRTDQVLPSLRTRGAFFVKGVPARAQMAGMQARVTGPAHGKSTAHHMADPELGILLGSGIVGASITVAVGASLALKLTGTDNVVLSFFGDGASQRGDFHEGLNLAGAKKLPVIFVIENNGYAEMTPLATHFGGAELSDRAKGYGFPGFRVDGNDVLAMYDAVQDAVERARAGEGPTLLDCVTYRLRGHSEINLPTEARDPREIEEWKAKDPVPRMRTLLQGRDILDADGIARIDAEVTLEIDEAVQFAIDSPTTPVEEIYMDVYAPEDPALVAGRRS